MSDNLEIERPRTRGDCAQVPRPCPFVSCRHHLYLDATERGLRIRFAGEPDEMAADRSCSLDIAEMSEDQIEGDEGEGGAARTLRDVAALMGITRQAAEVIEASAMAKFKRRATRKGAA